MSLHSPLSSSSVDSPSHASYAQVEHKQQQQQAAAQQHAAAVCVHCRHAAPPAASMPLRSEAWWELSAKREAEALSQHGLITSAVLSSSVFLLGVVLSGVLALLPADDSAGVPGERLVVVLLLLFAAVFCGLFMLTVVYCPLYFFWKWDHALKLEEAADGGGAEGDGKDRGVGDGGAAWALRRQARRLEVRCRKELVLRWNNVLFSVLLVSTVCLQLAAVVALLVSVICRAALLSSYAACYNVTLRSMLGLVAGWLLVLLVSLAVPNIALRVAAAQPTSQEASLSQLGA